MIAKEKLNNLHKLDLTDIGLIFLECEEALGLVDVETASIILGVSKRRVYQMMNDKNSISIGRHKFPCINLMVK